MPRQVSTPRRNISSCCSAINDRPLLALAAGEGAVTSLVHARLSQVASGTLRKRLHSLYMANVAYEVMTSPPQQDWAEIAVQSNFK